MTRTMTRAIIQIVMMMVTKLGHTIFLTIDNDNDDDDITDYALFAERSNAMLNASPKPIRRVQTQNTI